MRSSLQLIVVLISWSLFLYNREWRESCSIFTETLRHNPSFVLKTWLSFPNITHSSTFDWVHYWTELCMLMSKALLEEALETSVGKELIFIGKPKKVLEDWEGKSKWFKAVHWGFSHDMLMYYTRSSCMQWLVLRMYSALLNNYVIFYKCFERI